MITINLNPSDQGWALEVANQRWRKGRGKPRFKGAKLEHHQLGAMAELAFCRALGVEWTHTVDTFKEVPDVPPRWEVRFLNRRPGWEGVKVLTTDADERLAVWVTGRIPRLEVMGWFQCGGAKHHPEWWKPLKEAPLWLVPESKMIPINPGFHDICPMEQDSLGLFSCAFCGRDSTYAQA